MVHCKVSLSTTPSPHSSRPPLRIAATCGFAMAASLIITLRKVWTFRYIA